MEKLKKSNKGITLVALVVTIIILLILVAVTIVALTGENGLLKKADTASEENRKQTATEIMNLKITNAQMQSYTEKQEMPTLQYLADMLCEDNDMDYVLKESQKHSKLNEKIDVSNLKFIYTKLEEFPYEFKIDGNLRLAAVDGIEIADNNMNKEDFVSKEEYNTLSQKYDDLSGTVTGLLQRIETLEKQPKNIERVNLVSNPVTIPLTTDVVNGNFANIELLDIEPYKYLEIQYELLYTGGSIINGAQGEETKILAVNQITYNNSNTANWGNGSAIYFNFAYTGGSSSPARSSTVIGWFKDKNHFYFGRASTNHSTWVGLRIKSIYGIR